LRISLLETLARRTEYNLALMQRTVRLFEIGAAFTRTDGPLPDEEMRAAAVILGHRHPPHWKDGPAPDADEWDAKWLAQVIARAAHPASVIALAPAAPETGLLWSVLIDGRARGDVRKLSLDAPPWASPAYGVEIGIAMVPSRPVAPAGESAPDRDLAAGAAPRAGRAAQYTPIPTTPATGFDVALLVPDGTTADRVEEVMRRGIGPLLERLELLSEFRGGNVPAGHRSVAWSLTLRHPERTLENREVAGRRDKMLRMLEGELGIKPRTS
jgi:phenylalanyl-tRNA synthetase beta chain